MRLTLGAAVWLLASAPTLAGAALPANTVEPTLYEFAHPNGGLILELDPLSGEPTRFAYRDRYHLFETGSDGIRVQETELGQQITVVLLQVPDAKTTTLTLVLPRVNLPIEEAPEMQPVAMPAMLTAYAILAIHRSNIAGPDALTGQIDIYGLTPMIGKAQWGNAGNPAQTSRGVIGRVLMAPTCPVAAESQPPCVAPFSGARVRLIHDTLDQAFETLTDERGLFAIEAPGGTYTLRASGDGPLPVCPEKKVSIPEAEIQIFPSPETRVYADLRCDTGIR